MVAAAYLRSQEYGLSGLYAGLAVVIFWILKDSGFLKYEKEK
jgi:hypothetical protein